MLCKRLCSNACYGPLVIDRMTIARFNCLHCVPGGYALALFFMAMTLTACLILAFYLIMVKYDKCRNLHFSLVDCITFIAPISIFFAKILKMCFYYAVVSYCRPCTSKYDLFYFLYEI